MSEQTNEVAEKIGVGRGRNWPRRAMQFFLVALVVLIAAAWWWTSVKTGTKFSYTTAVVQRADLRVTISATGSIEPTNLVEISSELSGTIKTVEADFNDVVTKGEILAELDTVKLEAQLAVSKASLDSAIAQVTMAEATLLEAREKFESAERLEQRGITAHQAFVSQRASYIRAQSEVQAAIANRSLAEAQVDLHQAELEKACICSPIEGVVLDRAIDTGQIIAAALSAPVLFTVAEDLTKMELQVDIDEADIGRAQVGNAAQFTVDAYDERIFPAQISEIRFAPETVDGVVTYKAVLNIENSELLLRPGMTANAEITVAEISDALVVPNAALRYAPPVVASEEEDRSGLLGMLIPSGEDKRRNGDEKTLWIMRQEVPQEISIRAGSTDGRFTEILEGSLSEGDVVITDRRDG